MCYLQGTVVEIKVGPDRRQVVRGRATCWSPRQDAVPAKYTVVDALALCKRLALSDWP